MQADPHPGAQRKKIGDKNNSDDSHPGVDDSTSSDTNSNYDGTTKSDDGDPVGDASTSGDTISNDKGNTNDSDNVDAVEAAIAQRVSKRLHAFLPPTTAPPYWVRERMFLKPPAGAKPIRGGVGERKDVSEAAGRGNTSKRGG
jgi:hypothetical protein